MIDKYNKALSFFIKNKISLNESEISDLKNKFQYYSDHIYNYIYNDAGPFKAEVCSDAWMGLYWQNEFQYYNKDSQNKVYFSQEISPQALAKLYFNNPDGKRLYGNIGIKLSTGEKGGKYYLNPNLLFKLVKSIDNATIVECNTAYDGKRKNTEDHIQVIKDHGFDQLTNVDIMDAEGDFVIPPVDGSIYLKDGDYVGLNLKNYDSLLVLSHGKGHQMAGMGGALKNISIGIASSRGKSYIHSAGKLFNGFAPDTPVDQFQRSMAEAAADVIEYFEGRMLFITVLNNISIDCDCSSHPKKPTVPDIGIICSTNPVALDQCMYDMFMNAPKNTKLKRRMKSRNAIKILDSMEELGYSRDYNLIHVSNTEY